MRELVSTDSFEITGRGRVYVFASRIWKPAPKVGEQLLIDGGLYTIKAIERFGNGFTRADYFDHPRSMGFLVNTSTDVWWASICSNHRETDPDCPRCKVGIWSHLPPEIKD